MLRKQLAIGSGVVRVLDVPLLETLLGLGRAAPTVKIEVVAASPGAASRKAEAIVTNVLSRIGAAAQARSWITSAQGPPDDEMR